MCSRGELKDDLLRVVKKSERDLGDSYKVARYWPRSLYQAGSTLIYHYLPLVDPSIIGDPGLEEVG